MAFAHSQNIDASHGIFNDIRGDQTNQTYIAQHINIQTGLGGISHQAQDALVNALPRVPQARYDANNGVSRCLENTRTALLREIDHWASNVDPNEPRIYWLSGLAGTGKSTIALTVAQDLRKRASLGASFFFSRDDFDRSHSTKVFSTLAHQLSFFSPPFKNFIADALNADPDVASASIKTQLEELIIKPLQRVVEPHSPTVIVMDALDECQPESDVSDILILLASEILKLPFLLKFFITSRPDHHILARFEKFMQPISQTLILHEIESSIVEADIERYLLHSFTRIGEALVGRTQWWREEELKVLAKKSAGLFIFASTGVKFINDKYFHNPRRQLNILLDMQPLIGRSPYQDLDRLYNQVLCRALPDDDDGELSSRFKTVVGAIVLLYDRLPSMLLESLLKVERGSIRATLGLLHSVIVAPRADDQLIRIVHPSFADFLTRTERCSDKRFFIDLKKHHGQLALRCLECMTSRLRRDICQIKDASKLNSEIEDLSRRLDIAIPPDLRYACIHWASHLSQADTSDMEIVHYLTSFSFTCLLYWFEALSLLGCLDVAFPSLKHAQQWFRDAGGYPHNIHELLTDANRFVHEFFEPISVAALHVYYSALPFTPSNTFLSKVFQHELRSSVKVLRGQDREWNQCLRVIEGHSHCVNSVAFSPDGTHIVSGSDNCMVQLWNSTTGKPIMTLKGHSHKVKSVAFSQDGTRIVSGSCDWTVRLWDSTAGLPITILYGHSDMVTSVAFSPDCAYVASGSLDKTIRLWDSITGTCITNFRGHGSAVRSVAFSPDGACIVSGGGEFLRGDHTVRLWDATTGKLVATLAGHSHYVTSVAYSPCGTSIVSGSSDCTVRLWDPSTGVTILTLKSPSQFGLTDDLSVAFSPDGKHIACCQHANVILWELTTGIPTVTFEAHSGFITSSIAFSPDGTRIVSGSLSSELMLWDSNTSAHVTIFEDHSDQITSIAFSPDGAHIVSGSIDKIVRLWDSTSGGPLAIFEGHSGWIRSVSFSPDSASIVSGSNDCSVRVWNSNTGAPIAIFEGHSLSVSLAVFSPDGTQIVSAYEEIRLWDLTIGACVMILDCQLEIVSSVAFSPDGAHIVSGSQTGPLQIWNLTSGACIATLKCYPDWITSIAYSPDSGKFVSGSLDGTVRLWNSITMAGITTIKGHPSPVKSVEFSADGACIVSKCSKGTVRFWDSTTGAPTATSLPKYTLIGQWVVHVDGIQHRKACWLPLAGRMFSFQSGRGEITAEYANCFVSGSTKGRLIILDFSNCTYT